MVESTEAELIKLHDKLVGFGATSDATLDRLILEVNNERERLATISNTVNGDVPFELGMESRLGLMQLQQRIKEQLTELTKRHRELHTTMSRVGKHIDKGFVSLERNGLPLGCATDPTEGASRDLLNRALAEHLLREGAAETAAELCREANILFESDQAEKYALLQLVVKSAQEWVKVNRDALHAKESCIEFQLAKLQFIECLPAVNHLIRVYPDFVAVEDLPMEELEGKMEVARALYERGLLVTERPLVVAYDNGELSDCDSCDDANETDEVALVNASMEEVVSNHDDAEESDAEVDHSEEDEAESE